MMSAVPKNTLDENDPKVKSFIYLEEADCAEGRHRGLQYTDYDDIMGMGNPLNSHPIKGAEWRYPVPGTIFDEWMSYFCSRR